MNLDSIYKYLPQANNYSRPLEEVIDAKFKILSQTNLSRDDKIRKLSTVNQYDKIQKLSTVNQYDFNQHINGNGAQSWRNDSYSRMIYAGIMENKISRINAYRDLAQSPKIKSALEEICDEFIYKDPKLKNIIKFELRGNYEDEVKEIIKREFEEFVSIYDLEGGGWKMCWDYLIEGELFYENLISIKNPEKGILGVTRIDSTRIDAIYFDKDNDLLDHFVLRKRSNQKDEATNTIHNHNLGQTTQALLLSKNQVTYVHSPDWDYRKLFRVPHIERGRRSHKQLQMIEDSAIIYMLTRAPERRVFNIAMGGLTDPKKVEEQMHRTVARLNTKKSLSYNGGLENSLDAQAITEDYYLPSFSNGANSSVTTLAGGAAIQGIMDILNNFKKQIYNDLRVPTLRLIPETTVGDGTESTREELRFAKSIMKIQNLFAKAIKRTFITHLKLKGKKLAYLANKFNIPIKESYQNIWEYYNELDKEVSESLKQYKDGKKRILESYNFQISDIRKEKEKLWESLEEIRTINEDAGEIKIIELKIGNLDTKEDALLDKVKQLKADIDDYNAFHTNYWDKYELHENDINLDFNPPTAYFELKGQQTFQIKVDNLNNLSQNSLMSYNYLLKKEMGWTDEDIIANSKWREYDAKLTWLVANIEANGPDFRKILSQPQGGDMGGGGGPVGGPGLGGPAAGALGGGAPEGPGQLADLKTPPDLGPNAAAGGGNTAGAAVNAPPPGSSATK